MGVFPAYAGVNPDTRADSSEGPRIPRVCGGEPSYYYDMVYFMQYSPRMRG